MPLHRHLRHSTSASAIPPRRLPSPSVLPATRSRPFVTNDIPSFNPTVAASAPRDILEHNDKGILPPHDPSHTTPFSTFSHPSIPDTAPPSHGHIERPSIPPVHASSPSPASLSALPTPRVDLRATTTSANCIMNEDIDGTTEQAEAEAAREPTSIPIGLPSNISISPVGYAPPSPSPAPAPRTMSRRFFTQLLEETRRRSRCTSQPSHPSSSPSTTTTTLPPSPTLSTIVVSPPARKSSLRPSVSAYPLGSTNTNTSAEDIDGCITETLYQLEQLAERVRLSSHSTSVLLASPTRTGFPKRSASVESLVDVCMRTPTPSPLPIPIPTRGHHVNGVEVVRVPQIVVTLPSSEDVPSSDTSSESSSNTGSSDSESGSDSEEGSVPEDVRWIAEYGRWSSASGSSSGEGSSTGEGSTSQESESEDDNDSEESDVSSLFVDGDGGDDGEGEGDDTDTLCTSPPTSPRGCDKGRRFMTEFELRSSSDTQAQGQGQSFTFSLRRPPSQLFRRPRVSVIRPSKSLVFQARTEMGQRAQRPPPFKLPQARSSPHKDLPSLPLSYSHSSHPSPFTPPDLGSCHHLLRESPSHGVLPAQSQSCWSISTDGHGGPGKGGKGGWTKGLKRLFGRAR